ncbi:MAG: hypothetical protein JOS17DRAFT_797984 [Linnemannia elongata]|nr:MAG: hypothetical protein JOS17DRAFT_797984 [Linnemannia elongata]
MKIFAATAVSFVVALTFVQAMPVPEKRALLDADITKADVGHNGEIVKVKPTHVSVAKKGKGLARVDTEGVNVGKHGSIAKVGEAHVFVAQKGHGIVDVHHDDIDVGKDGSIAHVGK